MRVHECTGVSAAWGPGDTGLATLRPCDPGPLAQAPLYCPGRRTNLSAVGIPRAPGGPPAPALREKAPSPRCGSGWRRGTGGDCRCVGQKRGSGAAPRWEITLLISPSLCWDAPGLGVSVSVSRSFQSRSGGFSHLDRA